MVQVIDMCMALVGPPRLASGGDDIRNTMQTSGVNNFLVGGAAAAAPGGSPEAVEGVGVRGTEEASGEQAQVIDDWRFGVEGIGQGELCVKVG